MASSDEIPPSLEADFVVLRKLRDDDESGALNQASPRSNTDRAPPSSSQGQNAVNEELVKALAKANGTCNNSCNCIVA